MTQVITVDPGDADLPEYIQGRKSDEHLFVVRNREIPNAVKTVVDGVAAAGFFRDKHYDIEYLGPNSTSKRAIMEEKAKDLDSSNEDFITKFRSDQQHNADFAAAATQAVSGQGVEESKPVSEPVKTRVPRGANS